MNPLWFIVGAIGGFMLARLTIILLQTEWRPRRCQRGKPCGCKTVRNGFGIYRYCDDRPAKEGKKP